MKKAKLHASHDHSPRFTWLILLSIVGIAAALRIWHLNKVPAGLYWDELDVGYQAYSFLKTGKDYFGNALPIHFHSFADFRTPLYILATVPFVAVFGLSAYTVRLPAALFGIGIILLLYLLVKYFTRDYRTGLITAAITALAPWHIQYSRMAFEATAMLFFFLLGLYGLLRGLQKPAWFIVGAVGFGLSPWAYSTAKFFIPFIFLSFLVLYFQRLKQVALAHRQWCSLAVLILSLLAIPLVYSTFFGKGGQRFSQIAIFTDPTLAAEIDHKRLEAAQASGQTIRVGMETKIINRLVFNKPTYLLSEFRDRYLAAFSTQFLFIEGDPNIRHSPKFYGEFLPIEALALLLGIAAFISLKLYQQKEGQLLLVWLFLAPIPAAITRDGTMHATRLFFLFPALTVFISLGIGLLLRIRPQKLRLFGLGVYALIWLVSAVFFLRSYYNVYTWESAPAFHYGFDQAVTYAEDNKANYDKVIVDAGNESAFMAYLFTFKIDPKTIQQAQPIKYVPIIDDLEGFKADNVYFVKPGERNWYNILQLDTPQTAYPLPARTLVIASASQIRKDEAQTREFFSGEASLVKTIYYPDTLPDFFIFTVYR